MVYMRCLAETDT